MPRSLSTSMASTLSTSLNQTGVHLSDAKPGNLASQSTLSFNEILVATGSWQSSCDLLLYDPRFV